MRATELAAFCPYRWMRYLLKMHFGLLPRAALRYRAVFLEDTLCLLDAERRDVQRHPCLGVVRLAPDWQGVLAAARDQYA
eukprot:101024-Prymnesium_polylepis.2